jgi:hypothetical protein
MASTTIDFVETVFGEASDINRNAVIQAARGNTAGANLIFRDALEAISHINDTVGTDIRMNDSNPPRNNISSVALEFSSDDEGFCVYNKLLSFEQTGSPANGSDLCFFSSAIIFNMGLVFHQHAAATGSIKFYKAADRMYEKCLNILQSFPVFCDADMDTLHLAALNNRAHIGFKIGTFDSADHSMSRIRELSCMLLYSSDATMPPHLEESMIHEILINSMVSGPGCAPSA